ncbi:MAG: histidine phosphatase family protein [Anaerolineales bacterium]|nr:histidine phosphatase family protein [Anaerolineales bacterium]
MTLLYLIRHARSIWNAEGRWQGQADPPLDAIGLKQAHALAERLRDEALAAVYSSPLARARQTAEIIAQACHAPLILDDRLKERDIGEWAGLTLEEVKTRYPDVYRPGWHINGAPGGETQASLMARSAAAFADIVAAHPDTAVAVVSHGGTLNAYLAHLFGTQRGTFAFDNAAYARVYIKDGQIRLLSLVPTDPLSEVL